MAFAFDFLDRFFHLALVLHLGLGDCVLVYIGLFFVSILHLGIAVLIVAIRITQVLLQSLLLFLGQLFYPASLLLELVLLRNLLNALLGLLPVGALHFLYFGLSLRVQFQQALGTLIFIAFNGLLSLGVLIDPAEIGRHRQEHI